MKTKVIVRAPALTRTGYGEHGRFVLRALRTMQDVLDIYLLPVNWGASNWMWEDTEERRWLDEITHKTALYHQQAQQAGIQVHYDMSVQVTIPNEWQKIAPINIGVTAGIESTKVAPVWLEKANEMDKIVTVSQHSKNVFLNTIYDGTNKHTGESVRLKCTTPVEVVHYPIKEYEATPLNFQCSTSFNFLTIAQWGPRKNIDNTICWFVEEFIDNPDVGLIVKVFGKGGSLIDREVSQRQLQALLAPYKSRQCKIYLLHGDLSEEEMHGLYKHPSIQAFFSLSHGEGFGLPHFEAAYSGLPVIAPEWSGYLDFLCMPKTDKKGRSRIKPHFISVDYEMLPINQEAHWEGVLEKDAMWCFPTQGSCKMKLREVVKDYGRFKKQAKTLQKWILQNFQPNVQYEKLVSSVVGNLKTTPEPWLPPQSIGGMSFCIPTNGKRSEKTDLTIKSIQNQPWGELPYEIIVCGDVENFQNSSGANIVLVEKKDAATAGRVATLRNGAVDHAQYDTIVFCDDDILLDADWLHGTRAYNENNGWQVLGNALLNPDGTRHWDRALLSPHVLVDYNHPSTDKNLIQTSGFFMIRRALHEIVQWNEECFVYADRENKGVPEDVQYSLDLHAHSIPLSFNDTVCVWHNDERYTQFNNQTLYKNVIPDHQERGFSPLFERATMAATFQKI